MPARFCSGRSGSRCPGSSCRSRTWTPAGRPRRRSWGEIWVRSRQNTPGYWRQPEVTAATITPDVREVAVIGVPHERWGETVKAVVVLRPGSTPDAEAIRTFAKERIASYKCPTSVDFVDSLPRNPSGKVLKKDLRAAYTGGAECASAAEDLVGVHGVQVLLDLDDFPSRSTNRKWYFSVIAIPHSAPAA